MRITRIVLTFAVMVAGCTETSQQEVVAGADCGPQVGMTGNLGVDIVGMWRWTWTGTADGGPSSRLMEFDNDGTAITTGHKNGPERWSYRVDTSEVIMAGADPGDDLQFLRTAWLFDGIAWDIASDEWYGDSSLERCTSP